MEEGFPKLPFINVMGMGLLMEKENPVNSPVDMIVVSIVFTWFYTSEVVQDFFHRQDDSQDSVRESEHISTTSKSVNKKTPRF